MKSPMNKTNVMRTPNEQGFASLVIALTLVIILALMTVGFAQLARREQRNALNKQLSLQAYYAAETGINDAVADITAPIPRINTSNTSSCSPVAASPNNVSHGTINNTLGVSYSCVSINLAPTSLVYTNVPDGGFRNVVFTNNSGKPLSNLTVSWTSTDSAVISGIGSPNLPARDGTWKRPALMDISLTPLPAGFNRDTLVKNNFTVYGYPDTIGGSVAYGPSTSLTEGQISNATCAATPSPSGPLTCSLKITGLNIIVPAASYVLHMTDHYDASNITVTAADTVGAAVSFKGAQAIIDSTGKARDVLKRIQVHVALDAGGSGSTNDVLPSYALEARNICKLIQTAPTTPSNSAGSTFSLPTGGSAPVLNPCYLN